MSTEKSEISTDSEETYCEHCDEPVDVESTDIFKSVSDQFFHRDCFAEHCFQRRSLVATPEGSFKIKPVVIREIEDGKEKVIDSFWRAECPVCYRTHESDEKTEEVRLEFIDEVTDCCGTEWLPPADWVEDCDICGGDHRESRGCVPLPRREPFPDPEDHRFDCAECDWSGRGEDFDNHRGECPSCGTTAVRAKALATDGGEQLESPVTREKVRPSQIQYQLLTAKLAIGDVYDSAEDAPDGVNEALEHITTAMNLAGNPNAPLDVCRPDTLEMMEADEVHSEMSDRDWKDIEASEFVDVAASEITDDMAFVFEHPELGLHGFRYRQNSKTLEPCSFSRTGGDSDA